MAQASWGGAKDEQPVMTESAIADESDDEVSETDEDKSLMLNHFQA